MRAFLKSSSVAKDSDKILHEFLEVAMNGRRGFRRRYWKTGEQFSFG